MKTFSNSDKLEAFIAPNIIYPVIFIYNNRKLAIYIEGEIHGLYCNLDMIGIPNNLTS